MLDLRRDWDWDLANDQAYAVVVERLLQHVGKSRLKVCLLNGDFLPIVHFRRDAGQQPVE
jgi:hypothetical protein